LRLTLLYTPGTRGGYRDQGSQDQGRHQILYALAGHQGDWNEGHDAWQAARLNQPLRAFLPDAHPGSSRSFSFLTLNSDQVAVEAVKKAEDNNAIIVRLQELSGQPAKGMALRFPVAITSAREVDGQERPMGKATLENGELAFDMKPFGLRSFALKLASPATTVKRVTSEVVSLSYDADVVSSRAKRTDGAMSPDGGTYPSELFPKKLTREGVDFQLGPTADGKMNALIAHGQSLKLPDGDFNRVHLLVAADGDTTGQITIGTGTQTFNVPNWTGYIGQWDNRLWENPTGKRDLEPSQPPIGLVPGYIKRTPVAWFATHHNTPQGDAFYNYSYLFQLSYDLPAGTKSLTLPDNSKIRVFAVSVAREPSATPPAAPLYDTLADHQTGGEPIIPQAGKLFKQTTAITLVPPLYHRPGDLHYTLDGGDPTATSPVYDQPFMAENTMKLAVAQIDEKGQIGPIVRGVVEINDLAPPTVESVLAENTGNKLDVTFSKPLDPVTAVDPKNYAVQPALVISKVELSADGLQVALTFDSPIPAGADHSLNLSGIKDRSINNNVIEPISQPFNAMNIVYALKSAQLPTQTVWAEVAGLPLKPKDTWTMNVLIKPDDTTNNSRAVIAGFGPEKENPDGGINRYFATYDNDIHLGTGRRNVRTGSPLEAGRWQMLTATYDGKTITLYKDGDAIGDRDVELNAAPGAFVNIGTSASSERSGRFHGAVQAFSIRRGALTDQEVKQLFADTKPDQ
jgi:alpha-mannosidase